VELLRQQLGLAGLAERARNRAGHREADDERAGALEELATTERDHAFTPAARFTARRIAMCVPQRHLRPANASRICLSVGFGVSRSSAAAVMTQPEVQYPHWGTCSAMNAFCTG